MGEKKLSIIRRKAPTPTPTAPSTQPPPTVEQVKAEILEVLRISLKNMLHFAHATKVVISEGEKTTIFEVDIAPEDFGRLLGAKGKNITALRTIVSVIAAVHGFRAILRVKDEDRFF